MLSNYKGKWKKKYSITLQYFTDTTDYRNYEKYKKISNTTYNSGWSETCIYLYLYENMRDM